MKKNIRNFSIIAHIDHGKSTLCDRFLENTGAIEKRDMQEQLLDTMDLERERGITIKAQAVRIHHTKDGQEYELNIIDTPGHVDFTYEVSRALAACEGAILIIDASQGIEAQTLANLYIAYENDLEIIPVLNKIDLPSADVEAVLQQVEDVLGYGADEILQISAKNNIGIDELLDAIVDRIPEPKEPEADKLRALIFDSKYDSYKGVIVYFRVFEGSIKVGDKVRFHATDKICEITEVGVFKPTMTAVDSLSAGQTGYLTASIKDISVTKVGDTIVEAKDRETQPLPGYQEVKPMVFCGIYPIDTNDYNNLKDAFEKLKLNDASVTYMPETSAALGFGFRCGFLGLLHLEIIQERIQREFDLDVITTIPSVVYKIDQSDGETIYIDNPTNFPPKTHIKSIAEPFVKLEIFTPKDFVGALMDVVQKRRGVFIDMSYMDTTKVKLHYELPLSEIIVDFYDKLKSITKGYASMEYDFIEYREDKLEKVDILLNHEKVDALSFVCHKDFAVRKGREICEKLKEVIPRQMFAIPIQAALENKVIARETISAYRKNVLAKCYGGDISRKRKLLDKQKAGKKKMKQLGKVYVPQDAFIKVLKLKDES